ncbi:MAG: pentapeptide repeat-containing protein [Pirellulaceae bacterium]|nr:pentapeptide repeat-containing protein [Pirellulaceae bacterium]
MKFSVDNSKARGLRHVLFGALLGMLATTLGAPVAHGEKPTREEVVAYVDECISARRKMDLMGRFGTDYSGLHLHGVDFRAASVTARGEFRPDLQTILRDANFRNCNLQGANFRGAILDGADFTGADLTDANFEFASLRKVTLRNANLTGTRFFYSNLAEAKLPGLDLSRSDVTGASFPGADLSGCRLAGTTFHFTWEVNWQEADLSNADLRGLTFRHSNFRDANLRSADLSGCDLKYSDFSGANLQDANLTNAQVGAAVLDNVRGTSDAEMLRLTNAAWRFEQKLRVVAFLDSFAFPMLLILFTPAILIVARRRWRRTPPDAPARFQFRLSSLLLLTTVIASFVGVAVLSPTGAYSYAMFGAFYMMIAEVVRGRASRRLSVGLLAAALVYVLLNWALYFIVGLVDALAFFDPPFMIGVIFVGPLLAIGGAIAAAIIAGRDKLRVLAPSLVGFGVWMIGVGLANVWLIGEISGSV